MATTPAAKTEHITFTQEWVDDKLKITLKSDEGEEFVFLTGKGSTTPISEQAITQAKEFLLLATSLKKDLANAN